jgi:hypothetical protein
MLIDKPFSQSLMEAQRFYQKSYRWNVLPGSADLPGSVHCTTLVSQNIHCWVPFKSTMAKVPTIVAYSPNTGVSAAVRDNVAALDRAVSGYFDPGDSGFGGVSMSTVNSAASIYTFHYTADTGW